MRARLHMSKIICNFAADLCAYVKDARMDTRKSEVISDAEK